MHLAVAEITIYFGYVIFKPWPKKKSPWGFLRVNKSSDKYQEEESRNYVVEIKQMKVEIMIYENSFYGLELTCL